MKGFIASSIALLCGALIGQAPLAVDASFSPPNIVVQSQCLKDGDVEVCAYNRQYTFPRLFVKYQGYLLKEENQQGNINVWAKLNSREGTFKLSHYPNYTADATDFGYEAKSINDITNVTCCYNWNEPPADEKALFFYAFDKDGRPNAWDVELAFFSATKKWDSKYGQNYKFRFI